MPSILSHEEAPLPTTTVLFVDFIFLFVLHLLVTRLRTRFHDLPSVRTLNTFARVE